MLKNRYKFIKKLFPEYIIIFKKNKYNIILGEDLKILKLLKIKGKSLNYVLNYYNINYVFIDNLDIIKIEVFKNNKYKELMLKCILYQIVNDLMNKNQKEKEVIFNKNDGYKC